MHAAVAFLSIALGGLGTKRVTRTNKVSMSELAERNADASDLSKSKDEDSSEIGDKSLYLTEAEVDAIFKEVDANNDGHLALVSSTSPAPFPSPSSNHPRSLSICLILPFPRYPPNFRLFSDISFLLVPLHPHRFGPPS